MSDNNKSSDSWGAIERFGLAIILVFAITSQIAWMGFRQIKIRSVEFLWLIPSLLLFLFAITFGDYAYLKWLHWIWPGVFTAKVVGFLRKIPRIDHFIGVVIFTLYFGLFWIGIIPFIRRRKFQQKLGSIGLTNAQRIEPKVVGVERINDNRTKLTIVGNGVGVDRFESKRGDLESALGQIVEAITPTANRKLVEIILCKKELTKILHFSDVVSELTVPYSFIVGESANGLIMQDIRELPHMLIAGSTGGGKSFFVRQVLLGLLHSSPHLQMYLIDLKRGVELKDFKQLPNVRMAKTEMEAVQMLKALRDEMHRRFAFMEEKNIKKIEPEKHKMDLIVLAVDEASVLYGKVFRQSSKADLVSEAREMTDELAKLARAAGIHIILATQKAVKESIDTKTLENLTGRMAFKMSTHAGSNTALGNVDAYSLPSIKGRGIWGGGNKFIEVQTPLITEEELDAECKALAKSLSGKDSGVFGPLLNVGVVKEKKDRVIHKLTEDEETA